MRTAMGTEERRRIYRREGDGYPSDLSWRYLSRDSFPSRKVRDMCERNDPVMFDNPAMLFGVGIFGFSVPPLKFTRRRASFEGSPNRLPLAMKRRLFSSSHTNCACPYTARGKLRNPLAVETQDG
jgi:hypothetical protein